MKKNSFLKIILTSFVVFSLLTLAACGSDESSGDESNEETFRLKLNSFANKPNDGEPQYYYHEWFVDEIEKRSNGRIKIDLYYSNQLAPVDAQLEALANGTIDMGITAYQYYGDVIPAGFVVNLPYWAESPEEGLKIMKETEVGTIVHEAFTEYGAKPLADSPNSNYGFILKKPVNKFEDMKGLILRQSGGLLNTWYKDLEVTGVDFPIVDSYDALSRGVADGIATGYDAVTNLQLHEVVDYIVYPPFTNSYFVTTFISTKTWDKIPEDLQEIILEVSEETEQKFLEANNEYQEEILNRIEDLGVEIIELSEEENEKFIDSTKSLYEEFAAMDERTARIVEVLEEIKEK